MNKDQRWSFIFELDDELLKKAVILSEWCSFIVREADTAFVAGANLAAIVMAMAGIETYLRAEYGGGKQLSSYKLIEQSPISECLAKDIHLLRQYRNRWVHVSDPQDDTEILAYQVKYEQELEEKAKNAIRTLRRTIYENPFV